MLQPQHRLTRPIHPPPVTPRDWAVKITAQGTRCFNCRGNITIVCRFHLSTSSSFSLVLLLLLLLFLLLLHMARDYYAHLPRQYPFPSLNLPLLFFPLPFHSIPREGPPWIVGGGTCTNAQLKSTLLLTTTTPTNHRPTADKRHTHAEDVAVKGSFIVISPPPLKRTCAKGMKRWATYSPNTVHWMA